MKQEYTNTTHKAYNTIILKLKLKLLHFKCRVVELQKREAQKTASKIT
jgi:hypothetical protein